MNRDYGLKFLWSRVERGREFEFLCVSVRAETQIRSCNVTRHKSKSYRSTPYHFYGFMVCSRPSLLTTFTKLTLSRIWTTLPRLDAPSHEPQSGRRQQRHNERRHSGNQGPGYQGDQYAWTKGRV